MSPSLIGRCGGGAGSTGLAQASNLSGSVNFADTGFNVTPVSMNAGNFTTTDATVFQQVTITGTSGIQALVKGVYFVWITVVGQSNAVPAAGSFIKCQTISAIGQEFDGSNLGGWFLDDATPLYEAKATFGWQATVDSPPEDFFTSVGQNSGGTILLQAFMNAVQIDTRIPA